MGLHAKSDVNSRTPIRKKTLGQSKRRQKTTLVFDEDKRREFLGGFRKRKVQRQKKAQEELQRQFKEERKKIKQDARERFKKLLSNRDIPELEQLLSEKEYEMDGRTVSVLEVDVTDLTEGNQWIGNNKCADEIVSVLSEERMQSVQAKDDVQGMSLSAKTVNEAETLSSYSRTVVNKKELKQLTKHATLKQMRKSKIFQKKQRLESQRNKKLTKRKNMQKEKLMRRKGTSVRTGKK